MAVVTCSSCRARITVKDDLLGRQAICPKCKARIELKATGAAKGKTAVKERAWTPIDDSEDAEEAIEEADDDRGRRSSRRERNDEDDDSGASVISKWSSPRLAVTLFFFGVLIPLVFVFLGVLFDYTLSDVRLVQRQRVVNNRVIVEQVLVPTSGATIHRVFLWLGRIAIAVGLPTLIAGQVLCRATPSKTVPTRATAGMVFEILTIVFGVSAAIFEHYLSSIAMLVVTMILTGIASILYGIWQCLFMRVHEGIAEKLKADSLRVQFLALAFLAFLGSLLVILMLVTLTLESRAYEAFYAILTFWGLAYHVYYLILNRLLALRLAAKDG